MIYRKLGNTGLDVSVAGYGGWKLSGKGWPGINMSEAERAFETAIESGVNLVDTAPVYGFGSSEKIIGRMVSGLRSKVIIATKCGLVWNERGAVTHNLSADSIFRECEQSLERLGTDYIDLYQTHWPDLTADIGETFAALVSLKEQGMIRHIGVCNEVLSRLEIISTLAPIVSVQNAFNYLENSALGDVLPWCRANGCGFIAYSPFAQGLLTRGIGSGFILPKNDVRRMNPLFSESTNFARALSRRELLGKPLEEHALQYVADTPGIVSALISMTRVVHVSENIRAVEAQSPNQ